jgi:hypothetical protein
MIEIKVAFDEAIDPIDPLGNIIITDGKKTIQEEDTYIDSWIDALITGLKNLQEGKNAAVDLVEEPEPILFESQQSGVRISYGDRSVFSRDLAEFSDALKQVAREFLDKINYQRDSDHNELLKLIGDFVKNQPDPIKTET